MIQHVYERARQARRVKEVWVATDDIRIARAVEEFGGQVVMTSADHPTGTHRVLEASGVVGGDPVVNLQGDEPLIRPDQVDLVIQALEEDQDADVATLCTQSHNILEIKDPNTVKVVTDHKGHALYFSRAPIPFYRDAHFSEGGDEAPGGGCWGGAWIHVGIYAYTQRALEMIRSMARAPWEEAEKLEQLRFLYWGLRIRVVPTLHRTVGVDVPEDLARVERLLEAGLSREGA
jgi:3-deoxy-manno-octulosonate cytidylyltransferase (CMP-KDO synthetase)